MVGSLPFLAIFALLGLQDPAPHEEKALDVRVRAVFPFLSGDLSSTDNDIRGATLDVEGDLDLESPGDSADLMISALVFPWFRIHAEYWVSRFQGSDIADESYFFGGSFYPQTARVDTDLEMHIGTLMGEYNVLLYRTPNWRAEIGLEAGLGIIGMDIEVANRSALPSFTERQRFAAPVPLVGLYGKLEAFSNVSLEVRLKGTSVRGFDGADITFLKGSVELQAALFKGVYISGGWHFLINSGKVEPRDDEEIDYDFTFNGPFFSFGYTF